MVYQRLTAVILFLCISSGVMAQVQLSNTDVCQRLVQHTAHADVTYQPGVDVNGNAVVPADLDSVVQPIELPEVIHVPITVDQAQKLNLPNNVPYKAEAMIGNVTVNTKTGEVKFNGQTISPSQINVLCEDKDQ